MHRFNTEANNLNQGQNFINNQLEFPHVNGQVPQNLSAVLGNPFMMNQPAGFEDQIAYYQQEACRLYIANVVLTNQVKELLTEKNELLNKISKLERQQDNYAQLTEDKKKRHRRAAHEIERHYRCPVEPCQKQYGSEGSLAQHIKLKHPDFYNTISNNISQTLSKLRTDAPANGMYQQQYGTQSNQKSDFNGVSNSEGAENASKDHRGGYSKGDDDSSSDYASENQDPGDARKQLPVRQQKKEDQSEGGNASARVVAVSSLQEHKNGSYSSAAAAAHAASSENAKADYKTPN